MTGKMIAAVLLATALSPLAHAQELQVGSNAYVDMYFADWHASKAQTMGPVTEYTVFTKGDPMKPTTKGAILRYVDSYVYATLAPGVFLAVGHSLRQAAGILLHVRHRHYLGRRRLGSGVRQYRGAGPGQPGLHH